MRNEMKTLGKCLSSILAVACVLAGCASTSKTPMISLPPEKGGDIVIRTASGSSANPFLAGREAAVALRAAMGGEAPQAILLAECFESKALKRRVLDGVASVFPRDGIFGGATYGSFSQAGCLDENSVGLMGIGGDGVSVSAALVEKMGVAGLTMEKDEAALSKGLRDAGKRLAGALPKSSRDRLVIAVADAHSPRNRYLIEGMQSVLGKRFPITGGSVNKNAGVTYLYYRGGIYQDAALALKLAGDFKVSLSGRQAQTNDAVISSAAEAAAEALANLKGKPFAMLAFNCAGRKGILDNLEDELAAIQKVVGRDVPIFGCYCAGEFGPVVTAEKDESVLSGGSGWHFMCTLLGTN